MATSKTAEVLAVAPVLDEVVSDRLWEIENGTYGYIVHNLAVDTTAGEILKGVIDGVNAEQHRENIGIEFVHSSLKGNERLGLGKNKEESCK